MPLDMQHEPIRLPAWVTALLVTFLPVVIAVLMEQEWRVALAAALAGLLPASGIVAVAESRRARTDSPATVQRDIEQFSAIMEEDPPTNFGGIPGPTDEHGNPVPVEYVDPDDLNEV